MAAFPLSLARRSGAKIVLYAIVSVLALVASILVHRPSGVEIPKTGQKATETQKSSSLNAPHPEEGEKKGILSGNHDDKKHTSKSTDDKGTAPEDAPLGAFEDDAFDDSVFDAEDFNAEDFPGRGFDRKDFEAKDFEAKELEGEDLDDEGFSFEGLFSGWFGDDSVGDEMFGDKVKE